MKNLKYAIALAVFMSISLSASAQALVSSYFIDKSLQRSALNPAFSPESNYFSFPVLSGVQAGLGANFGVDNFIFNKNGSLYTYLNRNVPAEEFCNKLKNDPTIALGANFKIIGLGYNIGRYGYLSIDADAILDGSLVIPKELFYLTKLGMPTDKSGNVYKLDNLGLAEMGIAQLGVAYKHDLSELVPGLSVGARVKYAALVEAAEVKANDVQLYMTENEWRVKTDAVGTIATEAVRFNPTTKKIETTGKYNLAGGGVLFDFGVEYKLSIDAGAFSGVNFAASVSNIGKVSAKPAKLTTLVSAGEVSFKGMSDVNLNTDFPANLEQLLNDFSGLLNFKSVDATERYEYKFKPLICASAEAVLFQNKLTAGVLYSNRYGFDELTGAINGKLGGFNASVTYNFITSKSFGFFLSFIPKSGLCIFLGSDYIPTRFTPQWIPLTLNADVRLGVSVVFKHRERLN